MNNKHQFMSKRLRFMSWLIIAFMATGPAFSFAHASDSSLSNDTTGSNSDNTNKVDQVGSFSFTVSNNGSAENNIDLNLNTGDNSISNNTEVGDITTGDVSVDANVENSINQGEVTIPDMGNGLTSVTSENSLTGANSENENKINIDYSTDIKIENISSAKNDFDLDLNTGRNQISGNTVVGDITTGSIKVSIGLINNLNGKGAGPDIPPVGPVVNPPSVTPSTPDVTIIIPPGAGAGIIEAAAGAGIVEAAAGAGVPVGEAFFAAGQTTPYILYIILLMGISYILFGQKLQLNPIISK